MNDKDTFRDDREVSMSNYSRGSEVQYPSSSRRRDLTTPQYFPPTTWSNGENHPDPSCRYIDNPFALGMPWDMMEKTSVPPAESSRRPSYSSSSSASPTPPMTLGFQNLSLASNSSTTQEDKGFREDRGCVLCKKNCKPKSFYSTHVLKANNGVVICPILREFTCPRCGATGDRAHTLRFCPVARKENHI